MLDADVAARRITPPDGHHFFGYYEKFPWNASGTKVLCLETDFIDHSPEPGETARILVLDVEGDYAPRQVAVTDAWNWQMGCMAQWLPSEPEHTIFYNDREGDRFVGRILNLQTGDTRTIDRPIYTISRDGARGLSVSFSRIHEMRKGYGYAGIPDVNNHLAAPDDDGIYLVDLATGDSRLIVSYTQAMAVDTERNMENEKQWFNHLFWSPDDSRIVWLHRRGSVDAGQVITRMMTADADGSAIACIGSSPMISHYDWQHPHEVLAWCTPRWRGIEQPDYWMINDPTGDVRNLGKGMFPGDGHCSWSPDREWVLTDTYPSRDDHKRTLMIWHVPTDTVYRLGRFYAPPELQGDYRCDLHPRWSRDGRQVVFDSAHEQSRGMYLVDVSELVTG